MPIYAGSTAQMKQMTLSRTISDFPVVHLMGILNLDYPQRNAH